MAPPDTAMADFTPSHAIQEDANGWCIKEERTCLMGSTNSKYRLLPDLMPEERSP